MNEKGALLAREGLRIFYHNHNLEFLAVGEGTALDLLIARTDSALVDFQLDVGWVAAAGIDPAVFITQYGPRISSLHAKDLTETPANTALVLHPADVGAGRQDWNAILRAAKAAGVRHYFIEQEPPFAHPRIDAARAGFNFIKAKFQELDFRAV